MVVGLKRLWDDLVVVGGLVFGDLVAGFGRLWTGLDVLLFGLDCLSAFNDATLIRVVDVSGDVWVSRAVEISFIFLLILSSCSW